MKAREQFSAIIVFALIFVLSSFSVASASMLTYTFDDGSRSIYDNAYPILSKYGQQGVVYAISERVINYYDGYITGSQFLQMQSSGWEVGSHSMKHTHLTQIPYSYEDEIVDQWESVDGYSHVYRCSYQYNDLSLIFVELNRFAVVCP